MATNFLQFKDGVIIEIGSAADIREEMHTSLADQVDTSMEMVGMMLSRILRPIGDAFRDLHDALDLPIAVDTAELKLGLSFSAEGNLFVAKSTAEGTLDIKVTFKTVKESVKPA